MTLNPSYLTTNNDLLRVSIFPLFAKCESVSCKEIAVVSVPVFSSTKDWAWTQYKHLQDVEDVKTIINLIFL